MPQNIKPTPEKYCPACGAKMERKRFPPNNRLEDLTAFQKRRTCGEKCMARWMEQERVTSVGHSRIKANRYIKTSCEACGETEKRLHVHHIDHDPFNNDLSNLITLCPSCHQRSHSPNYTDDGQMRKPCKHCDKSSIKAGLCYSHITRLRRYGNPLAVKVWNGSEWVLDTSGRPIRSRRSRKKKPTA
jgi:5-methylcytosine-specific restriction endonuclease McrA